MPYKANLYSTVRYLKQKSGRAVDGAVKKPHKATPKKSSRNDAARSKGFIPPKEPYIEGKTKVRKDPLAVKRKPRKK